MAATRTQPAPEVTGHDLDDLEQTVTDLLRVFARFVIRQSTSAGKATFADLLCDEFRAATREEATRLATWLETHP
jgi:hypothetical protein